MHKNGLVCLPKKTYQFWNLELTECKLPSVSLIVNVASIFEYTTTHSNIRQQQWGENSPQCLFYIWAQTFRQGFT